MNPVLVRYRALWLLAATLPILACAASVFVNIEPASWFTMLPAARRAATADALLYIAASAIVAAPLAGVSIASSRRPGSAIGLGTSVLALWPLVGAVGLFVAASAIVTTAGWGLEAEGALTFVATSHATLFAVTLALAAFGALCGTAFRDPLDAAACSTLIVLVATVGLFVAGAIVADVPRDLLNVALTASPLVAIVSAAHIDIVRMGLPYQMSPLAHLQVDYPAWYTACAGYLTLAGVCFAGTFRQGRSSST
jgi:hypothetical protein